MAHPPYSYPKCACLLAFLLSFVFISPQIRADESYSFIIKKQEEKEKTRRGWNLSDWLETRDRMRLMDLWLVLHSSSPYEYFLSGGHEFGSLNSGELYSGWNFGGAAFASIFGLEGRYDTSLSPKLLGIFDLRIFGLHDQASNITLQLGIKRQESGPETFRNALVGFRSTIYISRFFGFDGFYRHFYKSTPLASSATFTGSRYELGAFIDYKFLRVSGSYFSETLTRNFEGSSESILYNGFILGTKLYF